MRFILISILFSSLFASCTASTIHRNIKNTKIQDNQSDIKQKAEQLKKAYLILNSSPSTIKYEKEYFKTFPNSFVLLNSLFGYSDKEPMGPESREGPLYNEADLYIEAFFKLNGIEKTQYYNRIIDICINGRWYADGVNYFRHGMKDMVKSDINLFSELLSKRTNKEIKGFWYFYLDEPYPPKKLPVELKKVKEINGRIYSLMELALKEVQQAWKE